VAQQRQRAVDSRCCRQAFCARAPDLGRHPAGLVLADTARGEIPERGVGTERRPAVGCHPRDRRCGLAAGPRDHSPQGGRAMTACGTTVKSAGACTLSIASVGVPPNRCVVDVTGATLVVTIVAGLVALREQDSRPAQDASSARGSLAGEQWFDEVPDSEALAQPPSTGPAPAPALQRASPARVTIVPAPALGPVPAAATGPAPSARSAAPPPDRPEIVPATPTHRGDDHPAGPPH